MASNTYTNLTPAANLDQKTLNKMVWRSINLQASFNYERMQAAGWLYGILPGLLAIHGEDTDLGMQISGTFSEIGRDAAFDLLTVNQVPFVIHIQNQPDMSGNCQLFTHRRR